MTRPHRPTLASAAALTLALALAAGLARAQTVPQPAPASVSGVVAAEQDTQAAARLAAARATAVVRWRRELEAFEAAERELPVQPGGIVFVGSSTIRLWSRLPQDFGSATGVLNRGFGGSTLADCSLLVHELVARHRPRQVVLYAGDNDLAEGRTPLQVLDSFARFATALRAEVPEARITYVSIKPSPLRDRFLAQAREANNILGAYLNRLSNSDYVDTFTPMLGADGRARAELFRADQLHLNDAGYALWRTAIAPHLIPAASAGPASPAR